MIGVESAVDYRGDHAFGIVSEKSFFQDTLACAWFTQDKTKPTLLSVDFQDVEDFLLMGQEAKKGSDPSIVTICATPPCQRSLVRSPPLSGKPKITILGSDPFSPIQ